MQKLTDLIKQGLKLGQSKAEVRAKWGDALGIGPDQIHKYLRRLPDKIRALWDNLEDQEALGETVDEETLDMFFVRDAATAEAVVEQRGMWLDLNAFRFEAEIPLIPVLETLELAKLVSVDHSGGIDFVGIIRWLVIIFMGSREKLNGRDLVLNKASLIASSGVVGYRFDLYPRHISYALHDVIHSITRPCSKDKEVPAV